MKKNLQLFVSVLVLLLCSVEGAWAWDSTTYYARLKAQVATSSSNMGKVYAGTSTTAETYEEGSSTSGNQSSTTQDEEKTFYAFAQANEGYSFTGWSTTDGGAVVSTDNPYRVSVSCSSDSESSPTTTTVYANFAENVAISVNFVPGANGSYTVNGTSVTTSPSQAITCEGATALAATASSGYKFFGWYTSTDGGITKNYFSYTASTSYTFWAAATVYAEFIPSSTAVFIRNKNESLRYKSLTDALDGFTSGTISVYESGEVISGSYTIPQNVTLSVPYDGTYKTHGSSANIKTEYTTQSVFKTLTFSSGVSVIVNGAIEIGGVLCNKYAQGSKSDFPGNCCLTGTYGRIIMKEGSSISLENNSNLYAWGLILSDSGTHGAITAKSGSTVYEPFQLTNFSGGSCLDNWYYGRPANTYDFIYSQYYVQNIEVPLTYHFGATARVQMAINPSMAGDVLIYFVGNSSNNAMFQLSSGATLTKWYKKDTDRQCYSTTGNTSINDMVISVAGYTLSTSSYRLPLNNNISVTITSGKTTINANTILFADAEVNIAQGAELVIASGKSLWLYDKDQWGKTYDFITEYIAPLKYSWPNATYRTYSTMDDARLKVDGIVTVNGSLFTTEGGAAITSSGTGVISFPNGIVTPSIDPTLHPMTKNGSRNGSNTHADITVTPAQLHNSTAFKTTYGADYEYLATAGAAANATITYANGHWGWVGIWKDTDGTTTLGVANKTAESQLAAAAPEPTQAGYTAGWTSSRNATNQEIVYTLNWTARTDINYTVKHWQQNLADDNYTEFESETLQGTTATATAAAAKSYTGFTAQSFSQETIAGDGTTVVNIYYNRISYDLTWVTDGDALTGGYTSGSTKYGAAITAPATPTKTGYTFAGWSPAVAETMPAANTTYTATWEAVSIPSFEMDDNDNDAYYDDLKDNYNGQTVPSVTYNRTFTLGHWATLTLPFDVSHGAMTALGMNGSIYEFKRATGNANIGGGVTLYFAKATTMKAGQCYIVNANSTLAGKSSFTFSNVTFDLTNDNGVSLNDPSTSLAAYNNLSANTGTTGEIELVGTLRKGILKGGTKYMGLKDNMIYYPNTSVGNTVLAYRGLFRLVSGGGAQETMPVRFRMVVDGEDMGELEVVNGEIVEPDEARKFIRDGILYIERNGKTYTVQGAEVR